MKSMCLHTGSAKMLERKKKYLKDKDTITIMVFVSQKIRT